MLSWSEKDLKGTVVNLACHSINLACHSINLTCHSINLACHSIKIACHSINQESLKITFTIPFNQSFSPLSIIVQSDKYKTVKQEDNILALVKCI